MCARTLAHTRTICVRSRPPCAPSERPSATGAGWGLGGLMYACAGRCGCAHAYLCLEPLDLSVLVLQLRAKLIGRHLLSLHDLDQVDVLLHQDLTLDDDVRVARQGVGSSEDVVEINLVKQFELLYFAITDS